MDQIYRQIPISHLIDGAWYVGRGRNGNVGLWDAQSGWFLVISEKFNEKVIKKEPYYTSEYGCFQPYRKIDEGVVSEPFGKSGWDSHYGSAMIFKDE